MKIVLGTANFFNEYGLIKKKVKNFYEIQKILNFLKKKNIKYIDTANSYILSSKLPLTLNFKKFKVISKIKLPSKNKEHFVKNLKNFMIKDLKIFNQDKFETILLHNVYDIRSSIGKKFLKNLLLLKKRGITKNIGISIYDPKDFDFALNIFKPDVVQFPLNVFDQRFLEKKFLSKIKKNKIKSQARSIFLQGLILNYKNKSLFTKKKKLRKHIEKFDDWCKKNNLTINEASILFIKNQKFLDYLIIGTEDVNQIKQNLAILKKNKQINLRQFALKSKKLIDPRLW